MRHADGQRLLLKSKLLAGAAGMTAAAMSTAAFAADAAPPAAAPADAPAAPAAVAAPAATPAQAMTPIDPPKWLPYVDISGGAGSGFAIGRANAFVPFWQDLDSLAFVRFGADTGVRHSDGDFNLGLGYRTKLDDEWILGGFAGFDSTQTPFNHTFNQFSFGLEAMSADWDIRANAYLAKKNNRAIANKFDLYIHDTTIAILQAQEAAMSGFDGEVGYRVFNTDSTDVRVFAGAYTFHHADVNTAGIGTNFSFPYHDITGPKLRAEVNVFDLDMLGSQSRFSVEGQVSHDSVNHTSEYIGATLRIALNDPSGSGAQALDDLDRRMADPVRRNDNVLTQWHFNKPEPVIIYNGTITSKPTNTLYYAEQRSGAATGSYADPTTIQDATSRGGAGKNAFIVLTDAGGSTIDATGTTVQSGETVTGAGTFKVRGVNSAIPVFTHDFAPGSGPVSLSATSGNVLNITGDANLAGFSIVGPFVDGIYGSNVGNVTIANVSITGPGTNGMVFEQTDTSGTSNIIIKNSSITGVTHDGIDLGVSATAGNTSTTNLVGSNLVISAGHDGVSVTSSSSGTSNATVYAGIHDSTLSAGHAGAEMSGTTSGTGVLTQTLLVDPTVIHTTGGYGIYVHGGATSGTLTQNVAISDVKITGTPGYGLSIYGEASGAGHLVQNVEVQNLNIAPAGVGVEVQAYGVHGGQISQTVNMTNVVANGATHDGVAIGAVAYSGATVIQTVDINGLQSSNNGGSGVDAYVFAYSATGDAPSVAAQYLTVTNATLDGNGFAGVVAYAGASTNAVVREDVTVEHATLSDNVDGISVTANAFDGASSQQNIYFAYDTAQHNAADGVVLDAYAHGGLGFAAQYGSMYYVDASYNGNDGFRITARGIAADAEQQLYMVDVTGDHNGRDGLEISSHAQGYVAGSYASYPAHVEQDVFAIYGSFSHNAINGILINSYAVDGAAVDQYVIAYGIHADYNTENGILSTSYAYGSSGSGYAGNTKPTHLYTTLSVQNGTADHNGYSGIYQYSNSVGSTEQRDHVTVSGEHADYNAVFGFGNYANSSGYYSVNLQYVTLSGSTFDHNGHDGAYFKAVDNYGPGPYGFAGHIVTISDSDFSYNGDNGLEARADASGVNGRAEQYFTISYSNFSNNTYDGLFVANYAHDGTYLPGYNCFAVQGTAGGCAIVRSSVTAIGSHFDDNGQAGIVISDYAKNYGTIYAQSGHGPAPSLYLAGSTLDGNADYGLVLANGIKYGSAEIQTAVIAGTDISHNGRGGIYGLNFIKYGGEQYQTIAITGGSTIEHNGGDGIYIETRAKYTPFLVNELGVYNSSVSNNDGSGVYVNTEAKYSLNTGIGGVFENAFYSDTSTFDNNGAHGVFLETYAGNFAYAYQVVQSQNSDFSGNGTAASNKYGLASVFFSFRNVYGGQYVYSQNDTFTHNSGGGLELGTLAFANKYEPFHQVVSVTGDHFDYNGRDGLNVQNRAKYGTLELYQTLTVSDSTFDHNGDYGLYDESYAASGGLAVRLANIYSYSATTSASGNSGGGIVLFDAAESGAGVYSKNTVQGVSLNDNHIAGLFLSVYGKAGGATHQYNYVYGNTASGNETGIGFYSNGSAGDQVSFVGSNTAQNNTVYGIQGEAGNGAFQYIDVYSLGNTVGGSGTSDYHFTSSGGATQNIN